MQPGSAQPKPAWNRRHFLKTLAGGTACLLNPITYSYTRAATTPSRLDEHRIQAVEYRGIDLSWPRHVGKNSRLGNHGTGPKPSIIVLKTDQGALGWGMISGDPKRAKDLDPQILGKRVSDVFDPSIGVRSPVLRHLDIALHDLAGVILGIPVWQMLGAARPTPQPIYSGMIYFDDLEPESNPAGIEKVLENARWDYEYGYRQLKIKIGRGGKWMSPAAGLKRDIEVVREIHRALPECELLVDGNDAFTVETMVSFVRGIEDIQLFWIEEPFSETIQGWRKLRSWLDENGRGKVWRADGEYAPDYPVLEELGRDHTVNVRLHDILSYGFTAWRKLLPVLKAQNITSSPHAWGSGLNTFYIAHLGAGLGNVLTVEGVTCSQKDVDFGGNRIRNGKLEVSSAPGFGLNLR